MDKLQEIKGRISKLKGYQSAKPEDQYWMAKKHIDFLIDRAELSAKQQKIIEENKRQQEIIVIQFRQAREEIQRLTKENEELILKVEGQEEEIRDLEFENSNLEDEIEELEDKVEALEGAAE
ncbi:VWA domain-containing protein [Bacillus velezensis]|uniref:VWA domain-containing protein n=1 Tax=Bacillus velezensis TaxID=492670 RepID=UPI002FFDF587